MANHDLILGQSHNLGLRQNQQLVLGHDHSLGLGQNHDLELGQTHEHHLGMGHDHELDLGHHHDHELGLGQSQDDEGEAGHSYGHENDLCMDRKPGQGDHELALAAQNHELALSDNNELVVSENQELDDNLELTVVEEQEMGLEPAQDLTIEQSQLILYSPVIQARTLSIAPNFELAVGQEFPDVFSCRRALRDTAIALHFEMQTIKSDKTRFTAKCATEGCPWRIHAAKLPGVPTFTIRTIHESHTCGGISHLGHQQASVQWVANSVEQRLKENPNYRPKEILEEIHRRRVAEALERARTYQVLRANEAEFEVISHEGTNIVDIRNRCCLCRGWQLYGLPCAHAVAALLSCRQNVHRFTESCFTVATYRKTYSQTIHPIPDKSLWIEFSEGDPDSNKNVEVIINPPKSLRPPGRPRKKRVRAEDRGRVKRVVHCSRCNQTGHFRTTCAAPI
ncbi:hypothetical protein H0E87_023317 [Populus deltoides]|uniref:SWIM-type domain-containing protein n=1 Tax=Populus deltoides TaxID=3696 RepID=A0A8T2XG45_POPDE|nr:hypothetical protein H0E87_023317 [Populus deltoides]